MNTRPNIKSKYAASGSYGCIVSPALPNLVNSKWTEYPQNVTKIFFGDPGYYDEAIKASEKMYKMTRNNGHRVHTYKFNAYKGRDLNTDTRKSCKINSENSKLYPIRLPNLGVDVANLHSSEQYLEFRKVPFYKLLEGIHKCLAQVRSFQANGYIHGDIRPHNVMVDSKTSRITIIDFDWFMPKDEFIDQYPFGFFSNPPESLLVYYSKLIKAEPNVKNTINKLLNEDGVFNKNTKLYVDKLNELQYRGLPKYQIGLDRFVDILVENATYMKDVSNGADSYSRYANIAAPFFDSYGLCFTLLELMYIVYPSIFKEERDKALQELSNTLMNGVKPYSSKEIEIVYYIFKKTVDDVLEPSSELLIKNRISIEEAFTRFNKILDDGIAKWKSSRQTAGRRIKTRRRGRSTKHTLKRR